MNASQILTAITPVIEVLEELGVPYHIGGLVDSDPGLCKSRGR